jgi:membrane protein
MVNCVAPFCVITLLFSAIYTFVPDTRIEWVDVILGGAVTSLLFSIGKREMIWRRAQSLS